MIPPVWQKHLSYFTSRHIVFQRGAELSFVTLGNTVIRNTAADINLWWNKPVALFESIFKQFTALCICIILQVRMTLRGVWRAIAATVKKQQNITYLLDITMLLFIMKNNKHIILKECKHVTLHESVTFP